MAIRARFVAEEGAKYGADLDTGYNVVLRTGCVVGDNCCIWSNTVIDAEAVVGDRVRIHCGVYIAQGVRIEDDVFIGPGTVILNDKYPVRHNPEYWEPPIIKAGARIGGGVTILPGVTIGGLALIGGGAVVTKDVPAFGVWVGNPARPLGKVTSGDRKCC